MKTRNDPPGGGPGTGAPTATVEPRRSLLDEFAMSAVPALIAHQGESYTAVSVAAQAYEIAMAMMRARQ